MNLRPSGYEPDELPDCSTPQQRARIVRAGRGEFKKIRMVSGLSPAGTATGGVICIGVSGTDCGAILCATDYSADSVAWPKVTP